MIFCCFLPEDFSGPAFRLPVLGWPRGALPGAAATAEHVVAGAAAPEEARHLGRDGSVQHPRGNLEKNHGIHGLGMCLICLMILEIFQILKRLK